MARCTWKFGRCGIVVVVALVVSGALLTAARSTPQAIAQERGYDVLRFDYERELELLEHDGRLKGARIVRWNEDTGRIVTKGGTSAWIDAAWYAADAHEELKQTALSQRDLDDVYQLAQRIRVPSAFPITLDAERGAYRLHRARYLSASQMGGEVSSLAAVIQKDRAYLGQLELRTGNSGGCAHVVRVDQWLGAAAADDLPLLQWLEVAHTWTSWEANDPEGRPAHRAQMARCVQVHPARGETAARIVVRHMGAFRKGADEDMLLRNTHVVTTLTRGPDGLAIDIASSAGCRDGRAHRDRLFGLGDQSDWSRTKGTAQAMTWTWESRYHPLAPARRGIRPVAYVCLFERPKSWGTGRWDGRTPKLRRTGLAMSSKRWQPDVEAFALTDSPWHFDKSGELVVASPLGSLTPAEVKKRFAAHLDEAETPDERAVRAHHIDVILEWTTQLPQPTGRGPRDRRPSVVKLLPKELR